MLLKKTYESVGFFGMHNERLFPGRSAHKIRTIQNKIERLIKKVGKAEDFLWGCQNSINELELLFKEKGKLTSRQHERLQDLIKAKSTVKERLACSPMMAEIEKLWSERDRLLYGDDAMEESVSSKTLSA